MKKNLLLSSLYFALRIFSAFAQPANDACVNAIQIFPDACTYTTGALTNATQSIAPINCNGTSTAAYDVWYKFVATSTSHKIIVSPCANLDAVVDLRSGACTGTNIGCADYGGGAGMPEVLSYNSFSIGSTYYVRIYASPGAIPLSPCFDIYVITSTPVLNDNCSGAFVLTANSTCVNTPGSVGGATTTGGLVKLSCDNYSAAIPHLKDVWYKFTASTTAQYTVTVTPSTCNSYCGFDAVIGVYNACGGSELYCADYGGGVGGPETINVSATSGSTYYIRLYDYGLLEPNVPSFNICVTTASSCTSPSSTVDSPTGTASVTLTCTASGGSGGGYAYKWYNGTSCTGGVLGTNSTFVTSTTGYYSCKAYINGFESTCFSCGSGYATVNAASCTNPTGIVNNPTGTGPLTMICSASGGSGGGYAYKWYSGTSCSGGVLGTNSTLSVSTTGYYCCKTYITGYESTCFDCEYGYADITSPQPSISISSFQVPTWQREGDDLVGSITASYSNMIVGGNIQLDIYVDGSYAGSTSQWAATSTSGTHIFNFNIVASTLAPQPQNGNQVGYQIIYNATGAHDDVSQLTPIIERKWDHKNIFYHNDGSGTTINVPIKYITPLTPDHITIERDGNVAFTLTLGSVPVPKITLSGSIPIGSNGYATIPYSFLQNLAPGDFQVKVWFGLILLESQYFDFVKYSKIFTSNPPTNKIIVSVGGTFNEMDETANDLRSCYNTCSDENSNTILSSLENSGFDVWYIAQGNANAVIRNGYDIGKSLELIQSLNPSVSEIDIVSHSKGGLDVRAFLEGMTSSYSGLDNINYNTSPLNGVIKKVLFLGTPHNGAFLGGALLITSALLNCPGTIDLAPGSSLLNYLNNLPLPSNIAYANLAGYRSQIGTTLGPLLNLVPTYLHSPTDGIVSIHHNNYLSTSSQYQGNSIKQLYQNSPVFLSHFDEHKNSYLSATDNFHTGLNCMEILYPTNLSKILAFFNGNPPYTATTPFESCPEPSMDAIIIAAYGSLVPGAKIFVKPQVDTSYYLLGITNEESSFSGALISSLQVGDSILIDAPGYETLCLAIDTNIFLTRKIEVSLLKSNTSPTRITSPVLAINSHNTVTSTNFVEINTSCINVGSLQINIPFSQDTVWTSLNLGISSWALDTGLNNILVRFIGVQQDTVILSKEVYYLPDTLMSQYSYNLFLTTDPTSIGTKLYVNNQFIKQINSFNDTIPVLIGENTIKFSKFGYVDSVLTVDSATAINTSLQLFPHSYSSLTDSNIIDLTSPQAKIQYRKNVTVLDSAQQSIISLRQYDDNFSGYGLIPKSRKFETTHLNAPWSDLRFAAVLDQIENLSLDSIYLLRVYDDTSFTKIPFDANAIIAGYDSLVQKLTYNYINFDSGAATIEALAIMKKQAPLVNAFSILNVNTGDSTTISTSQLFSDPDSIQGDMTFSLATAPNGITVTINNGIVTVQTIPCFSGSTSFTINATHDELTAANTINVTVIGTPPPVITSSRNIFCVEDSALLTVTSALSYQWLLNGNAINGATDSVLTVTSSGNYSVTITDSSGCTSISSPFTLSQYPVMGIHVSSTDLLCNGDASGTASINTVLLGGSPPYSYSWSNGASTSTVSGLTAGAITTTIIDANGCSVDTMFTINQPLPLNSNTSSILFFCGFGVSCHGLNDGSIDLSVSGGTPPYFFSWNGGTYTTEDLTNLTAGVYYVSITDANGCPQTNSFTITEPAQLVVTLSSPVNAIGHNISCFGASSGIIHTATTGGCSQYSYDWGNGPITADSLANLPVGTYSVTVADQNGCSNFDIISLTEPTAIILVPDSTSSNCGQNNGAAQVTPGGGDAPYSYVWSNSATTSSISGLSAGAYSVTVTDANGCADSITIIVNDISNLSAVSQTPQNVLCYGGNTGQATVTPAGGTPPYTYTWSPAGGNDSVATNLTAGNYSCSIHDANGCITTVNAVITEPDSIAFHNTLLTMIPCFGGSDGEIYYTMFGGSPPFSFHWNDGDTNQLRSSLIAGTYAVIATDFNSCTSADTFMITQQTQVIGSVASQIEDNCFIGGTGSLTIDAIGGVPSYEYSIDSGATFLTSTTFTSLDSGVYLVIVRDGNFCSDTFAVTISSTSPINNLPIVILGDSLYSPYSQSIWLYNGDSIGTDSAILCNQGNYQIVGIDSNGCSSYTDSSISCTVGLEILSSIIQEVELFPNPTTGNSTLLFSVLKPAPVSLKLFDALGKMTQSILEKTILLGKYSIGIESSKLSAGIYIIEFKTDEQTILRKLTVVY
jgi:hypothetical protein